jgi:hypothetical protein
MEDRGSPTRDALTMCYRKGSEILKGCRIIHIVLDFIPIFSWHTEWELRCELHAISPRVVTLEVFLENRPLDASGRPHVRQS